MLDFYRSKLPEILSLQLDVLGFLLFESEGLPNDGHAYFSFHVSNNILNLMMAPHHLLVMAFYLRGAPCDQEGGELSEDPGLLPQPFRVENVLIFKEETAVFDVLLFGPFESVLVFQIGGRGSRCALGGAENVAALLGRAGLVLETGFHFIG